MFEKSCKCGKAKGKYVDYQFAEYSGMSAVPLGISNPSLFNAVLNQPPNGMGELFTAFVIPNFCETFVYIDSDGSGQF